MGNIVVILFALSLYFLLPTFVAKALMRVSWNALFKAYGVWLGMLMLIGITSGGTLDEAVGWPMLLALFLTTPAIAVLSLVLRLNRFEV